MKTRGIVVAAALWSVGCEGDKEPVTPHSAATHTGSTTTEVPALAPAGTHELAAWMSVGGAGPDDVWAVGATPVTNGPPLVVHRVGDRFEDVVLPTLHDLWWVHAQPGGDDLYFGGAGATVIRSLDGGATFERMHPPGFAGHTVYGVWSSGPDDVWAVGGFAGRSGFVWRWNGEEWLDLALPDDLPRAADGEVPALFKVWGRDRNDVYVVGGSGTILRWNGVAFAVVESGTTEQLFTVHGDGSRVLVVGGSDTGVALADDGGGFVDVTPAGAPLLQAAHVAGGQSWVAGAGGALWRGQGADWEFVDVGVDVESIHAVWSDGADLWAAGGGVLTPALNAGLLLSSAAGVAPYEAAEIVPPSTECPADAVDPSPTAPSPAGGTSSSSTRSAATSRNPPVHARNLFHHVSVAMYDAWAAYDDVADGVVSTERHETAPRRPRPRRRHLLRHVPRAVAPLRERAERARPRSTATTRSWAPWASTRTTPTPTGDDPIAVGNRVGQAVIDRFLDDGANEANGVRRHHRVGSPPTRSGGRPRRHRTTGPRPSGNSSTSAPPRPRTASSSTRPSSRTSAPLARGRAVRPARDPVTGLYSPVGSTTTPPPTTPRWSTGWSRSSARRPSSTPTTAS
jgi:hypothetical protein